MTVSAWVAFGSLSLAIVVYAVTSAFALGRAFQRITHVEREISDRSAMNDKVIEMGVKIAHIEAQLPKMSASMEGINRQLGNIAMGRIGMSGELK